MSSLMIVLNMEFTAALFNFVDSSNCDEWIRQSLSGIMGELYHWAGTQLPQLALA